MQERFTAILSQNVLVDLNNLWMHARWWCTQSWNNKFQV